MTIISARERGSTPGGNVHFRGEATISMLFSPSGPRDFSGAYVSFEPGARTAWHSHPAGQTLVVTEGHGWVQTEAGQRRDIGPGDVVWTPPGMRHWHGATASSGMTHLALQGDVGGAAVEWFEQVSDAQYLGTESEAPFGRRVVTALRAEGGFDSRARLPAPSLSRKASAASRRPSAPD